MTSEQIKWTVVYKSNNPVEAEIIKGHIDSVEIPCVVINKQDRSYLFGTIELNVPEPYKAAAIAIINEQKPQNT